MHISETFPNCRKVFMDNKMKMLVSVMFYGKLKTLYKALNNYSTPVGIIVSYCLCKSIITKHFVNNNVLVLCSGDNLFRTSDEASDIIQGFVVFLRCFRKMTC